MEVGAVPLLNAVKRLGNVGFHNTRLTAEMPLKAVLKASATKRGWVSPTPTRAPYVPMVGLEQNTVLKSLKLC